MDLLHPSDKLSFVSVIFKITSVTFGKSFEERKSFWYAFQNASVIHCIIRKQHVTQRKLMRLFEGDIKTDILNSTYCSISKENFDTKMIFISYFYQKLQVI